MSAFYDLGTKEKKYRNKGRIPGMIIFVLGISLLTWYITDTILESADMRVLAVSNVVSISRLIAGIIVAFFGAIIWKGDEFFTVRP